jgi:hypothetical protein
VSAPGRTGAAVRRAVLRLVPAQRRDWVEAVWAEAAEVPPGLRRLLWQAGGARLIIREAPVRRGTGFTLIFAAAAATVRVAWPHPPDTLFTPVGRFVVIALVVLAGFPLLTRPVLGPAGDSRAAGLVRAAGCAAFLSIAPAMTRIEQFRFTRPRGVADVRIYLLVCQVNFGHAPWGKFIFIVFFLALSAAAITWMTSRRARIAPATLIAGSAAGVLFALVMYVVAPVGLSSQATNPWLPGSEADPLVLLAWLLLPGAPVLAAVMADRRYTAACGAPPPRDRARQMMAAGLLTCVSATLLILVAGFGTITAMISQAGLRNWLYHGQHLLYGVQNLSGLLRTAPVIGYSHQITAATDAGGYAFMIIAFPVLMLAATSITAASRAYAPPAGQGGPPRDEDGPPQPVPPPPGGIRLAAADDLTAPTATTPAVDLTPWPADPGPRGPALDRASHDDACDRPAQNTPLPAGAGAGIRQPPGTP